MDIGLMVFESRQLEKYKNNKVFCIFKRGAVRNSNTPTKLYDVAYYKVAVWCPIYTSYKTNKNMR